MLWLALGGLTIVAPDLATAWFLAPTVLAVTHVYTVGAIVGQRGRAPVRRRLETKYFAHHDLMAG